MDDDLAPVRRSAGDLVAELRRQARLFGCCALSDRALDAADEIERLGEAGRPPLLDGKTKDAGIVSRAVAEIAAVESGQSRFADHDTVRDAMAYLSGEVERLRAALTKLSDIAVKSTERGDTEPTVWAFEVIDAVAAALQEPHNG